MARDIEKVRAARRRWYARNKDHAKEKVVERRRLLAEWFREFKTDLKCKCGEDHIGCLEFHHTDPSQKDMTVAQAVHNGWGKERILAEVEKCEVLCANCHRKLHWGDPIGM